MLTKKDLQAIDQIFENRLEKKLKPIRQDIQKIRTSQKKVDNYLDREHLHTVKRVDRIEKHLGLSGD